MKVATWKNKHAYKDFSLVGVNIMLRAICKGLDYFKNRIAPYRLRELTSWFHNAETKRDDFSCEKKVNHFLFICFDQGTYIKYKQTS